MTDHDVHVTDPSRQGIHPRVLHIQPEGLRRLYPSGVNNIMPSLYSQTIETLTPVRSSLPLRHADVPRHDKSMSPVLAFIRLFGSESDSICVHVAPDFENRAPFSHHSINDRSFLASRLCFLGLDHYLRRCDGGVHGQEGEPRRAGNLFGGGR